MFNLFIAASVAFHVNKYKKGNRIDSQQKRYFLLKQSMSNKIQRFCFLHTCYKVHGNHKV